MLPLVTSQAEEDVYLAGLEVLGADGLDRGLDGPMGWPSGSWAERVVGGGRPAGRHRGAGRRARPGRRPGARHTGALSGAGVRPPAPPRSGEQGGGEVRAGARRVLEQAVGDDAAVVVRAAEQQVVGLGPPDPRREGRIVG